MNSRLISHRAKVRLFGVLLLASSTVCAQQHFLDGLDIHVFGSNTARLSFYDSYGLGAASPYPFEGGMFFDEFNVYFDNDVTTYDRWYGEVSGVANIDDPYRTNDNGLVPERLNITRENGEVGLPYRFEAGDLFAYYSYLTLQRSLKGVQLEIQPQNQLGPFRHSLVISAGANESNWRDLTFNDNFTTGVSWLLHNNDLGSLSLNAVHNYRDSSNKLGVLDRSQAVFSVAGEKGLRLLSHTLMFEGEFAHFSGDHNGSGGPASGQNRSENGYFLTLRGRDRNRRLDYRFRFDHYGQDFRPQGGVVTPDRRSGEIHLGWRFNNGVRLRGRAQLFDDGFESSNKTRTRTYGAALSGPFLRFLAPDMTGALDAFVQLRDDELSLLDSRIENVNASFSKPLTRLWVGRGSFFLQNFTDNTSARADQYTRQITVSADRRFEIGDFTGVFTPGFSARTLRKGSNHSTDLFPRLALSLYKDAHQLRLDYGSQLQNRKLGISGPDIDTHTLNIDYRFHKRKHIFGVEGNLFARDPSPGRSTDAYRLSFYWTHDFDHSPRAKQNQTSDLPSFAATDVGIGLLALSPGSKQSVAESRISQASLGQAVTSGAFEVYEYPIFEDIFQRQRYAVQYQAGRLERSIVVIDFDDVGNQDSLEQTFALTREALIRQFGNPTRAYETGNFSAELVSDVNAQQLSRIFEWQLPSGVLRFGIPRRLDGQVRMEIHHAANLPPITDTQWSAEAIR